MRRTANQTAPKALRYLIGASILLLALMLFSELSCSILGLCTNWFPLAHLLGFWEVMGISTAVLFSSLAIHSLRRSRISRASSAAPLFPPDDLEPDTGEYRAVRNDPGSLRRREGWRPLIKQLSDEEKQRLKLLMEERCFGPGSLSGSNKNNPAE